ncbi:MAG TPA: preprotein translocase subunit YajC [Clostridiales bacterium]|nr:preprotein translocase subunit YajC [Clostridiales bacterium]
MPSDLFSCGGAAATGTAATGAAGAGASALTWLFPILLIVIFIIMIIVPNKRREKKFKQMMDSIKTGDQIKTIGGFYGKVVSIKEDLVTMECGPDNTKLVISKSAIASVESFEGGAEVNPK